MFNAPDGRKSIKSQGTSSDALSSPSALMKGGVASEVTCVKWHPSSKCVFASAHKDGCLLIFDLSKRHPSSSAVSVGTNGLEHVDSGKSKPERGLSNLVADESADPILRWKVSSSGISDFEFSSDGAFAATVHHDGRIFILDMGRKERVSSFKSYFGGLFSVAWSPDDRFIVCGGEDDLISIWNVSEIKLIARGYGHRSWVSRVCFHPVVANGEYRLMSVGHDARLAVWKFQGVNDFVDMQSPLTKASPDIVRMNVDGNSILKLRPEGIYPIHEDPIRGFAVSYFLMASLCSENRLKIWYWEPSEAKDEKSLFPELL